MAIGKILLRRDAHNNVILKHLGDGNRIILSRSSEEEYSPGQVVACGSLTYGRSEGVYFTKKWSVTNVNLDSNDLSDCLIAEGEDISRYSGFVAYGGRKDVIILTQEDVMRELLIHVRGRLGQIEFVESRYKEWTRAVVHLTGSNFPSNPLPPDDSISWISGDMVKRYDSVPRSIENVSQNPEGDLRDARNAVTEWYVKQIQKAMPGATSTRNDQMTPVGQH
jgi:hypothetical protein